MKILINQLLQSYSAVYNYYHFFIKGCFNSLDADGLSAGFFFRQ